MRLAFSAIAWDNGEDDAVVELLHRHGVDAVDLVPGRCCPRFADTSDAEIAAVRNWWAGHGFEITGMQALLFGTSGFNVFGPPAVREALFQHLAAVCRIGAGLGAPRLVFGSPKNRDRSGLSDAETLDIAVPFFRRLGEVAGALGVTVCLEPNPAAYGANFMTGSSDTATVVRAIGHPAIRMQLDTGALAMNGEDPAAVLREHADLIGHVHASEPHLVPLGEGGSNHAAVRAALEAHLPGQVVSIEMLATKGLPHLAAMDRALAVADRYYRGRAA